VPTALEGPRTGAPTAAVRTTLALLDELFGGAGRSDVAVRLWDGTRWPAADRDGEAACTIVFNHPGALRAMLWPPGELSAGEAYLFDDVDIEGDATVAVALADHLLIDRQPDLFERAALARQLLSLPSESRRSRATGAARLRGRLLSLGRTAQAVSYHYDRSNDFYALWLGRRMLYTCAYFDRAEDGLDTAQEQKLEYICRKLRLEPGERLLDIGCGWGGLQIYAAERFGVESVGITLSAEQARLAEARFREAGVADRCRVEVRDYRELEGEEVFDKVVSVGMLEHVRERGLPGYFCVARRVLRPGGLFLCHGMVRPIDQPPRRGPSFMEAYVFPDGELPRYSVLLAETERAGFEIRDAENLREHYELTVRHWLRNIEDNHAGIVRTADEVTYRVWRIYVAGAVWGFRTNRLRIQQTLLLKPPDDGASGLPLTREDWYA